MSTQVEAAPTRLGDAVEMTCREAVNAALEDEMAADPTIYLLGEDVANEGGVFKTNGGPAGEVPRPRREHADLREHVHRHGDRDVGHGPSARRRDHVLGLPADGRRRDHRGAAEVPVHDGRPVLAARHGALDRRRHRPLRDAALGDRRVVVHGASRACSSATAGTPAGIYGVLRAAIRHEDPVLFFEHKGLYGRKGPVSRGDGQIAEIGKAAVVRPGSDVTIVSTLLMLDRSLQAAEKLAAEGIDAEVIDLRWLRPLDLPTVRTSVEKTGRLVIAEEQVHAAGWGATLISRLAIDGVRLRGAAARRRAAGRPADPLQPDARGRDHPRRGRDRASGALAARVGRVSGGLRSDASRAASPARRSTGTRAAS